MATGSIYAIAASALVITYVASGVFNLAFAAMAFTVARFYYELHVEAGWGILPSALVSLGVFAPLLGTLLYVILFRFLQGRSTIVKLMATLGLSVALPPLVELVLGKLAAVTAPGLAPVPLKVFKVFGAVVNADQLAMVLGLVVVLAVGVGVLRFTDIGLKVRALVDSGALTSLNGSSPTRISMGVWAVSTTLAGLTGILIAPTSGLTAAGMTPLMATAFAAVVAARLKSLPVAVGVGLLIGLAGSVPQKWIDPNGTLAQYLLPSVPFIFMLLALLYFALRGQTGDQAAGGALDKAITVEGGDPSLVPSAGLKIGRYPMPVVLSVVFIAVVAILPLVFDVYWAGLTASGIVLAIVLLSYTLVTGEGGMLWLCQISFAGIGAIMVAELSTMHGWNPLVAAILGPIAIVPIGILIGVLTVRLGELYIALVTLSAGILAQSLVVTQDRWYNWGSGTMVSRPSFAVDNQAFTYLALGAFLVLAFLIINLRRSTAGLALGAVRWSESGAKTIGLSVVQSKVLVSALATYVAALGGTFIAMDKQTTLPDFFQPFTGLVWLAVLMTLGSRSVMAALATGLMYYMVPALFQQYLPTEVGEIPIILFGLGAVALASHPEGAFAQGAGNLAKRRAKKSEKSVPTSAPAVPPGAAPTVQPGSAPATVGERA
ncbi:MULTISPECIES: ABC transporter permease [unclassified Nocardioides]|uniref:ABC transporter permease n=1 Tax=unclassified Nocardioides TaxID=2615069 RepID=UPI002B205A99|nr:MULTISPECIES: ABC transporter permease [unclassified Nocardioides]